ncbi:uracil-DNA glycosylase [Candidatus Woesearchaeota archaeon]|nr:uracil-DNA glycosylase [Candidatus Woesearchaeota archaeon]
MNKQEALEKIKQEIISEMVCPLKDASTNIVFGKGNPNAEIMFIGEAPGEKEDLQGEPFVGAAGKQLDKLLQSIGLNLEKIYIANILKYRPPNNRDPTTEEIQRHTPYLIKQIKIIQPKIIATLGNYSTKFVLAQFQIKNMKNIEGITKLHGKPQDLNIENTNFKIMPLYHPAAMLYNPKLKTIQQEDFLTMEKILNPNAQKKKPEAQQKELNKYL